MTLSIKECAEKLHRAQNIISCLQAVDTTDIQDFVYLEIGTCFKEDEGLSTYVAARFLEENGLSGKVFSHEMIPEHVEESRKIVRKYDQELLKRIEWVIGNSAHTVPETLKNVDTVDVAFIDGGGHPLFSLFEFEALWEKLSLGGLILVDDCNYLPPSPAYEGRRDYGKAQLIMPFLMLIEYINFQPGVIAKKIGKLPDSATVIEETLAITTMTPFMKELFGNDRIRNIASQFQDMDFAFLGGNQLVIGRKKAITRLRNDNPKLL
jgi:predicted O-methyltransferase YrrM